MPKPITDADFSAEVLSASVPVVVDFWAPWCGPCRAMIPIFEELEKEYGDKVKLVKINVDEQNQNAEQLGIMSLPTFMIFKAGMPSGKPIIGARSKEDMKRLIDAAVAA
jgi:thioredoxin 1